MTSRTPLPPYPMLSRPKREWNNPSVKKYHPWNEILSQPHGSTLDRGEGGVRLVMTTILEMVLFFAKHGIKVSTLSGWRRRRRRQRRNDDDDDDDNDGDSGPSPGGGGGGG